MCISNKLGYIKNDVVGHAISMHAPPPPCDNANAQHSQSTSVSRRLGAKAMGNDAHNHINSYKHNLCSSTPVGFAVLASAVRLIVRVCPSASDQSRKPHKKQKTIALQTYDNHVSFRQPPMEGYILRVCFVMEGWNGGCHGRLSFSTLPSIQ